MHAQIRKQIAVECTEETITIIIRTYRREAQFFTWELTDKFSSGGVRAGARIVIILFVPWHNALQK